MSYKKDFTLRIRTKITQGKLRAILSRINEMIGYEHLELLCFTPAEFISNDSFFLIAVE